jgi:hypothetical protein
MDNLYIEFSVQYLDVGMFFLNFVQKYGRFNSPFFPIFIFSYELPPINYLILEANDDPLQEPKEIGKMSFMKLDSDSKVIIEVFGEVSNRWYTVEKLVKAILEDLWNKDYRINSVIPSGLLHHSKVGYTKKELLGLNLYVEGELITEETQRISGLNEEVSGSDLNRLVSSNPDIYLPKNKEVKKKWKKAYVEMNHLDVDYKKEYKEGSSETPNPSDDDYRVALIKIFRKKVSQKTIQRIRKAGKAGKLK